MAVTLNMPDRWLDNTTPSFFPRFLEQDEATLKAFGGQIFDEAFDIYRAAHWSRGEKIHSKLTRIDAHINAYARKIPESKLPQTIISREGAPPYDYTPGHFADFPSAIISERFAACLMELEPGKHQLSPMVVVDESGGVVGQAYFWRPMVILDAIDLNSTRIVFMEKADPENSNLMLEPGEGNSVKKDVISDNLAWADARCPSSLFVSDAFLETLSSRKIDDFSTRFTLKEI
ncbi:imm11 family protein [Enterovibrio norvegicus]|uniref:imm11 family protein n=1 Tax=Enterovibrio norvegicus TaxID=188144 RepID=UPI000C8166BF|nr:DUF1629 domain-containing protein [Enterovibrio norvegicus]PMI32078.1 hypothetical protein BCU47_13665 [Enterovibrio norvegicus]